MISYRIFVFLVIPVILLSFFFWFYAIARQELKEAQVAGEIVGSSNIKILINDCHMAYEGGSRVLVVGLTAENQMSFPLDLRPYDFHIYKVHKDDPTGRAVNRMSFAPISYQSYSDSAPGSVSYLPPGAKRNITLRFWGENMPRGDEWNEYIFSLEYYDTVYSIFISLILNPRES